MCPVWGGDSWVESAAISCRRKQKSGRRSSPMREDEEFSVGHAEC